MLASHTCRVAVLQRLAGSSPSISLQWGKQHFKGVYMLCHMRRQTASCLFVCFSFKSWQLSCFPSEGEKGTSMLLHVAQALLRRDVCYLQCVTEQSNQVFWCCFYYTVSCVPADCRLGDGERLLTQSTFRHHCMPYILHFLLTAARVYCNFDLRGLCWWIVCFGCALKRLLPAAGGCCGVASGLRSCMIVYEYYTIVNTAVTMSTS